MKMEIIIASVIALIAGGVGGWALTRDQPPPAARAIDRMCSKESLERYGVDACREVSICSSAGTGISQQQCASITNMVNSKHILDRCGKEVKTEKVTERIDRASAGKNERVLETTTVTSKETKIDDACRAVFREIK